MASSTKQPKAIFSTQMGKTTPRDLIYPLPPVIARSNGSVQVLDYASQLRERFPLQCQQIFFYPSLSDYFDRYDIHLQSPSFLAAVLNHIIQENISHVQTFAHEWSVEHRFELTKLCEPTSIEKVFNTDLIEKHGTTFLTVVLQHMRNSLAALSRQQMAAKGSSRNDLLHQYVKKNTRAVGVADPSIISGTVSTISPKNNWSSSSYGSPASLSSHSKSIQVDFDYSLVKKKDPDS